MGTLGAKTSQWRSGHVPYLPYPRYDVVNSGPDMGYKQQCVWVKPVNRIVNHV